MDELAVTLVVSVYLRPWDEILKDLSKVAVILVEIVVMTLMAFQLVFWPYYKFRKSQGCLRIAHSTAI
jgi:hypothetical protein